MKTKRTFSSAQAEEELNYAEGLRKTSNPFIRVRALKEAVDIMLARLMPKGQLLSVHELEEIAMDEKLLVLTLKRARIVVDATKTIVKLSVCPLDIIHYSMLGCFIIQAIYHHKTVMQKLALAPWETELKNILPHLYRDKAKFLHVLGRYCSSKEYPAVKEQVIALYRQALDMLPQEHTLRGLIEGEIVLVQTENDAEVNLGVVRSFLEQVYTDFQEENPHHVITLFTWFFVKNLPDKNFNSWVTSVIEEMKPRDPQSKWIVVEKRVEGFFLPIIYQITSTVGGYIISSRIMSILKAQILGEIIP